MILRIILNNFKNYLDKILRFFALRREIIALPDFVRIRAKKPAFLDKRKRLGLNVKDINRSKFIITFFLSL